MDKIFSLPLQIIKASRPLHWTKNLSLFAALVFSGLMLVPGYFTTVVWAFIAFSLASSATYIFNDVLDRNSDKNHPVKKYRPVASGKLPVPIALLIALFYAMLSLYIGLHLNSLFAGITFLYLILQILYSLYLKHVPVIDILVIASGFVIRVYAGAFVIDAHLSVWFLLCVISVALFLASGKRRSEINLIPDLGVKTRKALGKYPRELLNSYVAMFANAAWMSWALYSFYESPQTDQPLWLFLAEISKATTIDKLLMITIPLVIFGVMRYQNLIFLGKSEAPEKLLLTDKALVTSVVAWAGLVVWIFYGGTCVHYCL